jgi:sporulation protein YlmC with PRC-barrel domain
MSGVEDRMLSCRRNPRRAFCTEPYRRSTYAEATHVGRRFAPDDGMALKPLGRLDERLVGTMHDLRGWRVLGRDGTPLGTVAELIVDVEHGSPVYINVVPDGPMERIDECWIRVPYRHAALDAAGQRVVLSDVATLGLGTATAGLVSRRAVLE